MRYTPTIVVLSFLAGLGMVLVYLPPGQFEMGSSSDQRARPVHMVALDGFWIGQTEVTNAMFTAFLTEQGNQAEEGAVGVIGPLRP